MHERTAGSPQSGLTQCCSGQPTFTPKCCTFLGNYIAKQHISKGFFHGIVERYRVQWTYNCCHPVLRDRIIENIVRGECRKSAVDLQS